MHRTPRTLVARSLRPRAALALPSLLALCAGCASNGFHAAASEGARPALAPPAAVPELARQETAPQAPPAGQPAMAEPKGPPPVAGPAAPAAEEPKYTNLDHRFGLSVGAAFLERFDTTLTVSSDELGAGAILDLEDLLNVDDKSTVLRVDGYYNFNRRHSVEFSYYDIQRSGSAVLDDDVNVGEVTIPAGGVSTGFGTEIIKAAYRYNFVREERTAIGFSAGLHFMKLDFDIESSVGQQRSESLAANLPLPVVGLHWDYALGPKWLLGMSAEFLQVDIADFSGWIRDVRFGIEHDAFEHFGWGIGFNSFGLNASVDDGDLTAEADYGFEGFLIYLRAYV